MVTVNQHFRLHNWNDIVCLAERRIPGKAMGIGAETGLAGQRIRNGVHRSPFGKSSTQFVILGKARTQPIQTFCDFLTRVQRKILGTSIDLDSWNDILRVKYVYKRLSVCRLVPESLVKEYCATDILAQTRRGHQHGPVLSSHFNRGWNTERFKTFVTGRRALVHSQNSFAGSHHGTGCRLKCIDVHRISSSFTLREIFPRSPRSVDPKMARLRINGHRLRPAQSLGYQSFLPPP
jgi:hypothetical protein